MSEQLPAPLSVVCRVAGVSRSAACEARRRRGISEPLRRRPGPLGAMSDRELLAEIRDVLAESPFVGEGHRKVWARLRRRGVRTSRKRVLRLTRGAGLLAPTARVRKRAQRLHDSTITVSVPDTLWATDATEGWTEEGRCAVFVMIDHASGEAWADAGLRMDRFVAAGTSTACRSTTTKDSLFWGRSGCLQSPAKRAQRGGRTRLPLVVQRGHVGLDHRYARSRGLAGETGVLPGLYAPDPGHRNSGRYHRLSRLLARPSGARHLGRWESSPCTRGLRQSVRVSLLDPVLSLLDRRLDALAGQPRQGDARRAADRPDHRLKRGRRWR